MKSRINWGTPVLIFSREKHGNARVFNEKKYDYLAWCHGISSQGVLWKWVDNAIDYDSKNDNVYIHFAQPQDAIMFKLMFSL